MSAYRLIQGIWRSRVFRALVAASFCGALLVVAFSLIPSATADEHLANPLVLQLSLDREVEPVLATYIDEGIADAASRHAALVLITMDTPGGLSESMKEIIQHILASPVPVVVYVSPTGARGASAGFFILLSADIAAMAPGTHAGAASPVLAIGGFQIQVDETMRKKILNDATAFLRSYTEKRGRNPALAETAVTDAKAFTEKEALDGKLIDLIASSPEDLLHQLDGRTLTRFDGAKTTLSLKNASISPFQLSARQSFLARIVEPDVFFVLLMVGVLGLYTEFTHPGMFAPGVIGGIAMLLALYAMLSLPVSLMGLLLIALSLAFFVLEAKYPTHGVLGVGGVISMVLGALMLVKSPWTGMGVSLGAALGVAIPFAVLAILLARSVLRSRSWKQAAGKEEMLGEEGEVVEPVSAAPATGLVRVHGELWRAASPSGETIPKGARARVKRIDGLTVEVEPVGPRQSAST